MTQEPMTQDLHLRQVCLAASHLEPTVSDIADIMGLKVCFHDRSVARYGLENAVLPVGTTLLEVVAPIKDETAVGRFIGRNAGRGGYMIIFGCDDPAGRARHAEQIGVRVADVIEQDGYHGVQLHPRDCRGALIEFNHTEHGHDLRGPYPRAGPNWTRAIDTSVTDALRAVEIQSPDAPGLAQHWGRILQREARATMAGADIELPNCTLNFVKGGIEAFTALTFKVHDVNDVCQSARDKGIEVYGNAFLLGGVHFRLVD